MPVADGLSDRLKNKTVVVTRPAHQADNLCNLIHDNGGKAIRFPVLEIIDPPDPLNTQEIRSKIAGADMIIFISPNAVDYGMRAIDEAGGIPVSINVAAVGQGSAKKLAARNQNVDIFPSDSFNSEALLAMEERLRARL